MDTYIVTQEQIALILRDDACDDPFSLVRDCLLAHGMRPWSDPVIELFILGRRVLLLARPSPPRRRRIRCGEPRIRRRS